MGKQRTLYGRYLLKHDALTNRETKRVLDRYFHHESGLTLLKDGHEGTCGGCGRELYRLKTERYYGEFFCQDCVEGWTKR